MDGSQLPKFEWTDELEGKLKRLMDDGLSTLQCARELGTTKGSARSKADRRGWKFGATRSPEQHAEPLRTRPPSLALNKQERRSLNSAAAYAAVRAKTPPERREGSKDPLELPTQPIPPESLFLTLSELPKGGCKWPVGLSGEREHTFCGIGRGEDPAYCAFHRGVSRQPGPLANLHKLAKIFK